MKRRSAKAKKQDNRIEVAAWLIVGIAALALAALFVRLSGPEMTAAVIQSEIIALTNNERVQNSVGQLAENMALDKAAQAKAQDMAAKGYFSHNGPDGKTPWQWISGAGYDYQYAGENLAVRFVDSNQVVNAWMASPTHRANIVKPQYTQIGVGIADGTYEGEPATFVVQYFGAPAGEAAQKSPPAPLGSSQRSPPGTSASPNQAVSTAATASSSVAGAEAPAPSQVVQRSWWGNLVLFIGSALHSLEASAYDSQTPPVIIGESGASTRR